jgi:hypothetical protein
MNAYKWPRFFARLIRRYAMAGSLAGGGPEAEAVNHLVLD